MQNLSEQEQIDQELDMHAMVQEIREGQPKHTDVGWLQIFPEAKPRFGKFIKLRLRVRREILKIEYKMAEEDLIRTLKNNPPENAWADEIFKEAGRERLSKIKKKISAIGHQLEHLKTIGKKPEEIKAREQKINITESMIDKAREYPLDQLIEINRAGFAKCIWHTDKNPSMFCKKNFAHCFSCNKSGDTIAIIMQLEGLTFRQAVLRLQ